MAKKLKRLASIQERVGTARADLAEWRREFWARGKGEPGRREEAVDDQVTRVSELLLDALEGLVQVRDKAESARQHDTDWF